MHLYNLTLQRSSGICSAIHGNFSGNKQQEIALAKGTVLEIIKPDTSTGKIHSVVSVNVFGIIRSMHAFRLTGGSKDYLVVGSDSGRIVILEYNESKNIIEKVHQETFGKTGCRRIVPGQYLAVDPKGRAVMISAIEKQKLVYILNRDQQARLTISSPLEAHKSNTLVYFTVGIDVGFENPMFACLEMDYEEADNDPTGESAQTTLQTLTFYELDLGLNHVVRKYSEPLDEYANYLIAVPGGNDGPSGVLVCSENYLTYKNFGDQPDIRIQMPRRRNDLDNSERSAMIVCSATHKTKVMFFFLIQTEQGDVFKVTLDVDEDMVTEIKIKYFDTVPVAVSMLVLRTGFLFVASEFGNHCLYQIASLGTDDDEPEFSSATQLDAGEKFLFTPRELKNLILVDEMESLSPIMHSFVGDLTNEDTSQLVLACGRGPRSSLKILRHGLEVSEMAVSELPGSPSAVWTVKRHENDEFDAYIIVSFINATLVLSIGETVEEVTDSGFLGTTSTLSCAQIGDNALVQIYPEGIRHIRADKRVNEWRTPMKRQIVKCAINHRQVVIALSGGELVYFEMDVVGQLNEYTDRKEMGCEVICMVLGAVPQNEQRSRFLAVGLSDNTVRIISLDPSDCLSPLSMQALPAAPESLCIVEMGNEGKSSKDLSSFERLYLNVGLQNGVLLRTVIDNVSGDLSDTRTRYLGSRPVKLFTVRMQNSSAVLAISSRCWLLYHHQNRFHLTPLSYELLEFASGFSSEQCSEGIVAISSNTLRILSLEKLGTVFNQHSIPLEYTPRKFCIHYGSGNVVLIEMDHNALTNEYKKARKQQMAEEMVENAGDGEEEAAAEMAAAFLSEDLPENVFNAPKPGCGMWASQIKLISPLSGKILDKSDLEQNEAAFSIAMVKFSQYGDSQFVIVGTAKNMTLNPRSCEGGNLYVYSLIENGTKLELMHVTPIEEAPYAMCGFQGKLVVSVGRSVRLYDLGKKKLLRKCENKQFPNLIVSLHAMGHRIYACDVQESIFYVRYKRDVNQLVIFADDTLPRYLTASTLLDYDTVALGDKFGNVSIVRLPPETNDEVDEDPSANSLWNRGWLGGAGQKVESICEFHIGETITSLQKATLIHGLAECLVYFTLSGTIGILVPFASMEDHDFFQSLEMHLRNESTPLCGRDHLSFRSYYFPTKNVIDGDLCETFMSLPLDVQKNISEQLERVPTEVSKKLEDMRTQYAF